MRVLYFLNSFNGGGAENGLVTLLREGFFKGTETHVLAIIAGDNPAVLAAAQEEAGSHHVHVLSSSSCMRIWHFLWAFWAYPILLLKIRPHTVILSLEQSNLIGRFWGAIFPFFNLYSFEHAPQYSKKIYTLLLKWLSPTIKGLISDSPSTADMIKKSSYFAFVKPEMIWVPPYKTSLSSQKKKNYKLHNPISLMITGRLIAVKNHTLVFQALRQLLNKGYECYLHVVGIGELKKKLEKEVKELELTSHVIFHGYQANWAKMLEKVDIYIQPSHWEGLSLTLLEAMSYGVPAIATPIGGVTFYGKDKQNLLFVNTQDAELLADRLEKLILNDKMREKIGHNAQLDIQKAFGKKGFQQALSLARQQLGWNK